MRNIIILLLVLITSCNKGDNNPDSKPIEIKSLTVSSVTRNTISISASVSNSNSSIIEQGFIVDTIAGVNITTNSIRVPVTGPGLSTTITGLHYNRNYYLRAYIRTTQDTLYSQEQSIRTQNSVVQLTQAYQGGYVFYIDSTGEHGLIVAQNDIGRFLWQNCNGVMGTTSQSLKGSENTATIVSLMPASNATCSAYITQVNITAAEACYNLTLNGYDDWFLPSYHEFYLFKNYAWENRAVINHHLATDFYWTSTETSHEKALFAPGSNAGSSFNSDAKQTFWAVRPFRAF